MKTLLFAPLALVVMASAQETPDFMTRNLREEADAPKAPAVDAKEWGRWGGVGWGGRWGGVGWGGRWGGVGWGAGWNNCGWGGCGLGWNGCGWNGCW